MVDTGPRESYRWDSWRQIPLGSELFTTGGQLVDNFGGSYCRRCLSWVPRPQYHEPEVCAARVVAENTLRGDIWGTVSSGIAGAGYAERTASAGGWDRDTLGAGLVSTPSLATGAYT